MAEDVHAGAWEKGNEAAMDRAVLAGSGNHAEEVLGWIERSRELTWEKSGPRLKARLRRRAILVARSLPVFPGRAVLEIGGGSGIWTEHLAAVLGGLNPLTSVVFNEELARKARARDLPNTRFVAAGELESAFPHESFDYVVGTEILTDVICPEAVEAVFRWLKPGGQFLFFERNAADPLGWFRKGPIPSAMEGEGGNYGAEVRVKTWLDAAIQQGFGGIEVLPCEVISPPKSGVGWALGLILERAPVVRRFARIVSLRSVKPAGAAMEETPQINLARHRELFDAVSVVVPCHNEEANIHRLVTTLLGMYGGYIHEIVIVDDNSTDQTAAVASSLTAGEPRVKLVKRQPPAGVGRALRDGYAAACGKYILSIDCDFVNIAPEFRVLFDAVAEGCDGAIGSRFSSESALVRYPPLKILSNRVYHLLLNVLVGKRVRDVTNNLKLYRTEILKNLDIEENHFAANVETGLKPTLQGYCIREVPTSWINRTADMGQSSFNLLKVGPRYLSVLLRTAWRYRRGKLHVSQ